MRIISSTVLAITLVACSHAPPQEDQYSQTAAVFPGQCPSSQLGYLMKTVKITPRLENGDKVCDLDPEPNPKYNAVPGELWCFQNDGSKENVTITMKDKRSNHFLFVDDLKDLYRGNQISKPIPHGTHIIVLVNPFLKKGSEFEETEFLNCLGPIRAQGRSARFVIDDPRVE